MKEFKKENLKEVIDKQFEIAGYDSTFETVSGKEDWLQDYFTTIEKEKEFKEWLIKYLIPFTGKFRAEREAGKLILNYGLIVKE